MRSSDLSHDDVANAFRISDAAHSEVLLLAGSLDRKMTEVNKRTDKTGRMSRDVLYAREKETRNFTVEETLLSDIDDAEIRDDPDREVVLGEDAEGAGPKTEEPESAHKARKMRRQRKRTEESSSLWRECGE